MTPTERTSWIIDQMLEKDQYSRWLGIERLEEGPGHCRLRMRIRPEMLNGFDIAHGGVTFAFADSAFAFASNSQGRKAVSIETSISHIRSLRVDEVIEAEAREVHLGAKTAIYQVTVTRENDEVVALFKGTVYRTSKEW